MIRIYLQGGHTIEAHGARVAGTPDYNEQATKHVPDLIDGVNRDRKVLILLDNQGRPYGQVERSAIVAYEITGDGRDLTPATIDPRPSPTPNPALRTASLTAFSTATRSETAT